MRPDFTMELGRIMNKFILPDDVKYYIEGLRLAGLPE